MKQLNSWFEKLKLKGTAGRASNANGNESETQSTISLPRSSYYRYRYAASASSNNNNNSNRNNSRLCGEMPAFRSAGDDNAVLSQILFPNRRAEDYSGHKAQPGLVESSVSAGCSCRAGIAAYSPSKRKNKRNKNTRKKKKELKAVPMTVFSAMDGGQRDAAKPVKARNKVIADETKFQELEKQEKDDANHFLRGDSNRCSALCCSCRLSVCPSFRQDESSAGIVNLDLWSDDESEADELPFLSSRESVCNCRNINRNSVVFDMKLRWGPFCDIGETAATLFRRPDAVDSHAQAEAKIRQMILNNNESSLSTFIPPKNQDPANGNSRIGQATAKTERSGFRHCKQAVNRGHYNPSFEQVSCRGSHRPGNNAAADYHSVNVSRRERCFRLNDCQPHTDNFITNPIYDDLQHGRTYFPDDLKSVDSKWWDDMVMSESSVKEYECEMNMPPRNSVAVSYNDNASRKSEDAALWLHSVNSVAVSYNDNASRKSDDAALRPHFMKCGSCGQPKSKLAQSKVRKSTDYPAISDLDSETESLLENLVESEASSAAAATANEGEAEADAEAEEETDARKKISESFAMVKSSYNPERDFRESMLEMIFENDIRDPRDLQELLDCYISLNSKEYHPVILHVFQQIESRLLQMASV